MEFVRGKLESDSSDSERAGLQNIPFNAILGEEYGGTDKLREMRGAVQFKLDRKLDVDLVVPIMYKSKGNRKLLSVGHGVDGDNNPISIVEYLMTIPKDRQIYYSDLGDGALGKILFKAKNTSVSIEDTYTYRLQIGHGEIANYADHDFVVYKIVCNKVKGGAVESVQDPEIVATTVDNSVWPVDNNKQYVWGYLAPKISTANYSKVNGAERWSEYKQVAAEERGGVSPRYSNLKFQRLGGGSVNAYTDGGSPWISYNRTSIGSGEKQRYYEILAGKQIHDTHTPAAAFWKLASIPGNRKIGLKVKNDDKLVLHTDEPQAGLDRIISGQVEKRDDFWSWRFFQNVNTGDEWDINQPTTGHIRSGSTEYRFAVVPNGAFSGTFSTAIKLSRSAKYSALLYAPQDISNEQLDALWAVGVDLAYKDRAGSLKGLWEFVRAEGDIAAEVAATFNFAAELNRNAVRYLDSDGTVSDLSSTEGLLLSRTANDPSRIYHVKEESRIAADWTSHMNKKMPVTEISSTTEYVFSTLDDPEDDSDDHHFSTLTVAGSGVTKSDRDAEAEIRLGVGPVVIPLDDMIIRIRSVNNE